MLYGRDSWLVQDLLNQRQLLWFKGLMTCFDPLASVLVAWWHRDETTGESDYPIIMGYERDVWWCDVHGDRYEYASFPELADALQKIFDTLHLTPMSFV